MTECQKLIKIQSTTAYNELKGEDFAFGFVVFPNVGWFVKESLTIAHVIRKFSLKGCRDEFQLRMVNACNCILLRPTKMSVLMKTKSAPLAVITFKGDC